MGILALVFSISQVPEAAVFLKKEWARGLNCTMQEQ